MAFLLERGGAKKRVRKRANFAPRQFQIWSGPYLNCEIGRFTRVLPGLITHPTHILHTSYTLTITRPTHFPHSSYTLTTHILHTSYTLSTFILHTYHTHPTHVPLSPGKTSHTHATLVPHTSYTNTIALSFNLLSHTSYTPPSKQQEGGRLLLLIFFKDPWLLMSDESGFDSSRFSNHFIFGV